MQTITTTRTNFILKDAIEKLQYFKNWTNEEKYTFLEAIGAVSNGRLDPEIKNYWQSTQTAAGGIDVTAHLLKYLENKTSDFINYKLISEVIKERREDGIKEWGVPLHTDNGRDQATNLEEELADAIIYIWAMKLKKMLITPRIRNLTRMFASIHEALELGRL